MVFPDEPTEGPLSLRAVDESLMRREMAAEGFRFGSYLRGNCTDNAKTQYYTGEATRGPDNGPIVACTNSGSGLIYAIFKSKYKVEVAISWPRGTSALASSFNLPNGPVAHWNIFFVKHFASDGSQQEEQVSKLVIDPDAGDTTGGTPTLKVRWLLFVRSSGDPFFHGYGGVQGKNPAKLLPGAQSRPYNLIKWDRRGGEALLRVTGGSYTAVTRKGKTAKTLVLNVKVVSSGIPSCDEDATGTVQLVLKGAGPGPDARVTRNVCGREVWDSTS
jgi:hypothetical protein